jgi:hypothetical protein
MVEGIVLFARRLAAAARTSGAALLYFFASQFQVLCKV